MWGKRRTTHAKPKSGRVSKVQLKADVLFDWLYENGHNPDLVEEDSEITICCPLCADERPRLYISIEHGGWLCFHCSEEGNLLRLLMALDNLSGHEAHKLEVAMTVLTDDPWDDEGVSVTGQFHAARNKTVPETELTLPRQYRRFSEQLAAEEEPFKRYYRNRGITDEVAYGAGFGYAISGRYANRLIVPVTFGDKLYTYVARTLLTQCPNCENIIDDCTCKPYKFPKVLTPQNKDGAQARGTLFNLDGVVRAGAQQIAVVEGVFDALRRPYDTVAILGAGASRTQINQLLALARSGREITLALDPDTAGYKGMLKLGKALGSEMVQTKVALLPTGLDPNKMDDEAWYETLLAAKTFRV